MKIYNLYFDGPYYYDRNFTQDFACVYAIVINDRLIYTGITDNINMRMSNHHKIDCWKQYSIDTKVLYIYKESNLINRQNLERAIINYYKPTCNDR